MLPYFSRKLLQNAVITLDQDTLIIKRGALVLTYTRIISNWSVCIQVVAKYGDGSTARLHYSDACEDGIAFWEAAAMAAMANRNTEQEIQMSVVTEALERLTQ